MGKYNSVDEILQRFDGIMANFLPEPRVLEEEEEEVEVEVVGAREKRKNDDGHDDDGGDEKRIKRANRKETVRF